MFRASCKQLNQHHMVNSYLSCFHIDKRRTVSHAGMAISGCRTEKDAVIPGDPRRYIELPLDSVIPDAAPTLQKPVRRHRPCIPMAAFILIERVAGSPVIAVTAGTYDIEPVLHAAKRHQMGRHLIFDAG